ncbi:MAG: ligase-associated DNA damage response exonuclease [Bacteroidia bacterium]|nr:ligase-associated DNA damage response exonuclease [Bacteroidia bacterium]
MKVLPGWVRATVAGLYCEPGDFFIDPWRPVKRALITHAHSDHARGGSAAYLTAEENVPLLRLRLGAVSIEGIPWGESRCMSGVRVSFHPAGHIRGSSQIRLEYQGEVCVITGDYKRHSDPTTVEFEVVRADILVSESTFGLPIYQWAAPESVIQEIAEWWSSCHAEGKNAILYAYSLGKAQRLLSLLPPVGPVYVHGSIAAINEVYEAAGISLLPWRPVSLWDRMEKGILLIAPPAVQKSRWLARFEPYEEAQASGWMAVRGRRRQRALDRGFVLSDHADFYQLMETLRESGAEKVVFTHGYTEAMVHFAQQQGYQAYLWKTDYAGEVDTESDRQAGGSAVDASPGEFPPTASP